VEQSVEPNNDKQHENNTAEILNEETICSSNVNANTSNIDTLTDEQLLKILDTRNVNKQRDSIEYICDLVDDSSKKLFIKDASESNDDASEK